MWYGDRSNIIPLSHRHRGGNTVCNGRGAVNNGLTVSSESVSLPSRTLELFEGIYAMADDELPMMAATGAVDNDAEVSLVDCMMTATGFLFLRILM